LLDRLWQQNSQLSTHNTPGASLLGSKKAQLYIWSQEYAKGVSALKSYSFYSMDERIEDDHSAKMLLVKERACRKLPADCP